MALLALAASLALSGHMQYAKQSLAFGAFRTPSKAVLTDFDTASRCEEMHVPVFSSSGRVHMMLSFSATTRMLDRHKLTLA